MKELRNRADDAARNKMMHEHEGVHYNVPLMGQHFENLLNCIARLYSTEEPCNVSSNTAGKLTFVNAIP